MFVSGVSRSFVSALWSRAACMAPLLVSCSAGGPTGDPALIGGGSGAGGSSAEGSRPSPSVTAPSGTLEVDGLFGDADLRTDACDGVLPIVVRDFSHEHADFEMLFPGDEPRLHLLAPDLGADGKPVFLDGVGCPRYDQSHRECNPGFFPTDPVITSAQTFNEWYRDVEGVNMRFEREIELLETPVGSGVYTFESNDFFPIAPTEGHGATPPGQNRNFLFTTEIRTRFTYLAGQVFEFLGDDDLWIFVNGKLALDLGGMHGPREAIIDFDAQAAELGIRVGQAYSMDVFHAERHTSSSNFRMETNIACFTPILLR